MNRYPSFAGLLTLLLFYGSPAWAHHAKEYLVTGTRATGSPETPQIEAGQRIGPIALDMRLEEAVRCSRTTSRWTNAKRRSILPLVWARRP